MNEQQYFAFYFAILRKTARQLRITPRELNSRVHNWMADVHGYTWPTTQIHRALRAIRKGAGL